MSLRRYFKINFNGGGEVFTDWDVLFLLLSMCLFIKYRSAFFIMLCLYERMKTGTLSNPIAPEKYNTFRENMKDPCPSWKSDLKESGSLRTLSPYSLKNVASFKKKKFLYKIPVELLREAAEHSGEANLESDNPGSNTTFPISQLKKC